MLIAACSPAVDQPTTATSAETAPTTSTSASPSTGSSVVTTTSAPSTTTGTAGELPFIVSRAGLIGYFDGGHWVTADLDTPVQGGEVYEVVDLSGVIGTSTGGEISMCEPAGTPLVALDPPLVITNDEPGEVAITGAGWDLTPRPIAQPPQPPADLVAEAVAFITDRGLDDPEPFVSQYLVFDLEGDGTEEEALVISRLPPHLIGDAGSYSLVMMRKQLDVEPATLVVAYSQGVADNAYVVSYLISAVADFNGDGKMEIVIDGHYYEGNATSVFEYIDDDLGLLEVLASGCGA